MIKIASWFCFRWKINFDGQVIVKCSGSMRVGECGRVPGWVTRVLDGKTCGRTVERRRWMSSGEIGKKVGWSKNRIMDR